MFQTLSESTFSTSIKSKFKIIYKMVYERMSFNKYTRHRDISQEKASQGNFQMCLSLFIITKLILKSESFLLFKLN